MEPLSKKLKSRKFVLTILVAVLAIVNEAIGLNLEPAALAAIAGPIAAWVFTEGQLDKERIRADMQVQFQNLNDQAAAAVKSLQAELTGARAQVQSILAAAAPQAQTGIDPDAPIVRPSDILDGSVTVDGDGSA